MVDGNVCVSLEFLSRCLVGLNKCGFTPGHPLHKHHQNSTRRHPEREERTKFPAGERKKERNFGRSGGGAVRRRGGPAGPGEGALRRRRGGGGSSETPKNLEDTPPKILNTEHTQHTPHTTHHTHHTNTPTSAVLAKCGLAKCSRVGGVFKIFVGASKIWRELQTCTFEPPGASKHHQNSTKGPQKERRKKENCGGRGKKARNLGPTTLRGPTLRGLHPPPTCWPKAALAVRPKAVLA